VEVLNIKNKLFSVSNSVALLALAVLSFACDGTVQSTTSVNPTAASTQLFATTGARGVKIITSDAVNTGSFVLPALLPTPALIPSGYPGYDGVTSYNAGVSATTYFDFDGTTVVSQPAWLTDFQLGITSLAAGSACATFGGNSAPDAVNFYRVSETDCKNTAGGSGVGLDPIFFRAVLNRNTAVLGAAENLLVQVEYQASALHLNSDGTDATNVENNLDQLWKIFWNSSLGSGTAPNVFSLFVPPNYAACIDHGTGFSDGKGNCDLGVNPSYKGASVKTKQFIIPLASLPNLTVLQFSRMQGRINRADFVTVGDFCASDSPLCLGVVIRSVTLTRM
jgi:hypothetical protein